jgi:hypothetical protein
MIWGNLFGSSKGHLRYPPESFADKRVFIRRTWLQDWVTEEGADALEGSEWLVVCCAGRMTYGSSHVDLQREYSQRRESHKP